MADELGEVDADAPETLVEISTRRPRDSDRRLRPDDRGAGAPPRRDGDLDREEIAVAEAVAREVGLAIHTAEILGENRERLKQQQAL